MGLGTITTCLLRITSTKRVCPTHKKKKEIKKKKKKRKKKKKQKKKKCGTLGGTGGRSLEEPHGQLGLGRMVGVGYDFGCLHGSWTRKGGLIGG